MDGKFCSRKRLAECFDAGARAAVLPDMERWRDNFVLMVFDGEPTADHERIARLLADEAKRIAGAPRTTMPLPTPVRLEHFSAHTCMCGPFYPPSGSLLLIS